MIEKLERLIIHKQVEMVDKINELIDKLNDDPNEDYYKCTECGYQWFTKIGGGGHAIDTSSPSRHHHLKCKRCGEEQTIHYYFDCEPLYKKYRPDKDHMGGYVPW